MKRLQSRADSGSNPGTIASLSCFLDPAKLERRVCPHVLLRTPRETGLSGSAHGVSGEWQKLRKSGLSGACVIQRRAWSPVSRSSRWKISGPLCNVHYLEQCWSNAWWVSRQPELVRSAQWSRVLGKMLAPKLKQWATVRILPFPLKRFLIPNSIHRYWHNEIFFLDCRCIWFINPL